MHIELEQLPRKDDSGPVDVGHFVERLLEARHRANTVEAEVDATDA